MNGADNGQNALGISSSARPGSGQGYGGVAEGRTGSEKQPRPATTDPTFDQRERERVQRRLQEAEEYRKSAPVPNAGIGQHLGRSFDQPSDSVAPVPRQPQQQPRVSAMGFIAPNEPGQSPHPMPSGSPAPTWTAPGARMISTIGAAPPGSAGSPFEGARRPPPAQERSSHPPSSVTTKPHHHPRSNVAQSLAGPESRASTVTVPVSTHTSANSRLAPATVVKAPLIARRPSSGEERSTPAANVLFILQKEMSGISFSAQFARARTEIVKLMRSGGIDLENVLESNTTLPALHEAKLPTSIPKLSEYRPHMLSRRLVPGIDPDLFLTTFQRWYKFTLEVGVSTFPICGPVVAEFLRQETTLASGERPKLVWILEQYRKGTIQGFVDRSSRDPQLRKTLEQKWGQQEWALWERYVDLSRFTLGDWKTIEELAPPAPVVSRPLISSRSTPNASRNGSPASLGPAREPTEAPVELRNDTGRGGQGEKPDSAHPLGLNRHDKPRRRLYVKRKLPPDEKKADEDFYVAVGDCRDALGRALFRMHQERGQIPAAPPADHSAQDQLRPGSNESSLPQPKPIQPKPRPRSPPRSSTTNPWSDYLPSVLQRTDHSEPIIAHSDPPPLVALSLALPQSIQTLRSTITPLQADGPQSALPSKGLASDLSRDPTIRCLTLTPQHFLAYPRCLTPASSLPEKERARTFQFASDLAAHNHIAQVEKDSVGDSADEREVKKKIALGNVVGTAIAASRPFESELRWIGTPGDAGQNPVSRQPREPEAAKRAREIARRAGVQPIYQIPQAAAIAKPRAANSSKGVAQETVAVAGAKVGSNADERKDRKGKRSISEVEADVEGAPTQGNSKAPAPKVHRPVPSVEPPIASPLTNAQPLARSAPVVPTLSVIPPDTAAAPAVPAPSPSLSAPVPPPTTAASANPRRPSLSSVSVSAPVVPQQLQQRSRSKSTSQEPPNKLRRRTSITAAGISVHPLAHLYASQSPQFRQGARLKAAEIVAATKSGIIPAAKSPLIAAKVLTEGAVLPKGSPRLGIAGGGGSSALAKSPRTMPKPLSPPLVPIPLQAEQEGSRPKADAVEQRRAAHPPLQARASDMGAMDIDPDGRLEVPPVSSNGSSSALGVILELPSPRQAPSSSAADPPSSTAHLPGSSLSARDLPNPGAARATGNEPAQSINSRPGAAAGHMQTSTRYNEPVRATDAADATTTTRVTVAPQVDTAALATSVTESTTRTPQEGRPTHSLPASQGMSKGKGKAQPFDQTESSLPTSPSTVPTRSLPAAPAELKSPPDSSAPSTSKEVRKADEAVTISADGKHPAELGSSPRTKDSPKLKGRKHRTPTVDIEIVPPPVTKLIRKDHPLRHVSKKVLKNSEPVYPFGRSG